MTIVLIDGRSGSGKTTLAAAIAEAWPAAQTVHMDDLYPGWDGLAAGSAYLVQALVNGAYERWDWTRDARAERHPLGRDLIVEGAGSLTRATRPLADLALWVELDEPARRARALARDTTMVGEWDAWAEQERTHIEREDPASLADAVVDGADLAAGLAIWRARL